jgi:uncharacterized protein YrrD
MRVDLDAKVLTRDGEHVGSVQRAVIDPDRNEIGELVISTGGWLGRDVLLPIAEIDRARADGDAIRLSLSKDEVERLPDYVPASYGVPPGGWTYTGMYGMWPYGAYAWPAVYAPGAYTAPAYASSAGRTGDEDPSIGKGAVVFDRNGDNFGVVDDVLFDAASGRLRGFVVRVGGVFRTLFGGGDTVEIARGAVDRVQDGAVHLRVAKEQVEHAANSA